MFQKLRFKIRLQARINLMFTIINNLDVLSSSKFIQSHQDQINDIQFIKDTITTRVTELQQQIEKL